MSLTRSIDEIVRLAVVADPIRPEGLAPLERALDGLAEDARAQDAEVIAVRADVAREALATFTRAEVRHDDRRPSFGGVLDRIGDLQTLDDAPTAIESPFLAAPCRRHAS